MPEACKVKFVLLIFDILKIFCGLSDEPVPLKAIIPFDLIILMQIRLAVEQLPEIMTTHFFRWI